MLLVKQTLNRLCRGHSNDHSHVFTHSTISHIQPFYITDHHPHPHNAAATPTHHPFHPIPSRGILFSSLRARLGCLLNVETEKKKNCLVIYVAFCVSPLLAHAVASTCLTHCSIICLCTHHLCCKYYQIPSTPCIPSSFFVPNFNVDHC